MQNLRLLNVQEVHTFGDIKRHAIPLAQCQIDGALLMQQREESATKAKLSQDQDVASLIICAGSHEID